MIALAANKIDLQSQCGKEPLEYARDEGLLYAETSAKSGAGVSSLFLELARTVPEMLARKQEAEGAREGRDVIEVTRDEGGGSGGLRVRGSGGGKAGGEAGCAPGCSGGM